MFLIDIVISNFYTFLSGSRLLLVLSDCIALRTSSLLISKSGKISVGFSILLGAAGESVEEYW